MKPYFHFKVFKKFMANVYKEAIDVTHLHGEGEQFFYESLWFLKEEGSKEEKLPLEYRTCVLATKGNEKYIIPERFVADMPFAVVSSVPVYLKKADKKIWRLVTGIRKILLPPNKDVNVRSFIDGWNDVEHSNPQTWTMLKLICHATKASGIKLCIASDPSCGKNANLNLCAEIKRDVLVIGTPSIARYETALFYNRVINLNEMGKPKPDESDAIRDVIIWLGDQSVTYNKRTLAIKRGMDSLDITRISNIITYNRKRSLKQGAVFFDDIFSNPGAIKNRIPQFLFEGSVTEMINDISQAKAQEIVDKYSDEIKQWISDYMGLEYAIHQQQHHYDRSALFGFTPRQLANIQGLLDIIDAYCQTEDEFIEKIVFLNNAKIAYDDMVRNEEQTGGVINETPFETKITVLKAQPKSKLDVEGLL